MKMAEYGADAKKSEPPSDCYTYDDKGDVTYKDPVSGREYVLNKDKTDWVPKDDDKEEPKSESEEQQKYDFDGKTYRYKDKKGQTFVWDLDKKEWVKLEESDSISKDEKPVKVKADEQEEEEESEEDDDMTEEERKKRQYRKRKAQPGWGQNQANYYVDEQTGAQMYKDPNDGMVYEWDKDKKAWFPKIDEDFMAQYQMSYGFTKDGVAQPTVPDEPKEEEDAAEAAKKAKPEQPKPQTKWFQEDQEKSTKVYVSNLPEDTTEEQFIEFMTKCGMIDIDVRSNKPKIKLYRTPDGHLKGDALCTYVKVESVQLALQILDGSRLGKNEIKVERAKFEMKGEKYDPKLKPKKLKKKEMELLKKKHEKMFAWEPDKLRGERSKKEKVIVIKNLFAPQEFDQNAAKMLEISQDLRERCSKFGKVTKVVVYDKHPEGVAQVFFSTPTEADMAIDMMNGRLSRGRELRVATWDGKTKYKVQESEEEEKERLAQWEKFLEGDGDEEDEQKKSEKDSEATAAKQ